MSILRPCVALLAGLLLLSDPADAAGPFTLGDELGAGGEAHTYRVVERPGLAVRVPRYPLDEPEVQATDAIFRRLESIGLGPRYHGVVDVNGAAAFLMEEVPGLRWEGVQQHHIRQIVDKLASAGIFHNDLFSNWTIDANGRPWMVDPSAWAWHEVPYDEALRRYREVFQYLAANPGALGPRPEVYEGIDAWLAGRQQVLERTITGAPHPRPPVVADGWSGHGSDLRLVDGDWHSDVHVSRMPRGGTASGPSGPRVKGRIAMGLTDAAGVGLAMGHAYGVGGTGEVGKSMAMAGGTLLVHEGLSTGGSLLAKNAGKTVAKKVAGRVAAKLVPILGWGLTAWDAKGNIQAATSGDVTVMEQRVAEEPFTWMFYKAFMWGHADPLGY